MTDHTHRGVPVPIGDVVPGDPPVPITVWHVPAARTGETVSGALADRLVHNFTHPNDVILDVTAGPQLGRAITAAGRRHRLAGASTGGGARGHRPALIVAGWPTRVAWPGGLFTACRTRLRPGGCAAIVVDHTDPVVLADLILAGHRAELAYLQHIVAAHELPTPASRPRLRANGAGRHLRVHTDVLIMIKRNPWEAHHV